MEREVVADWIFFSKLACLCGCIGPLHIYIEQIPRMPFADNTYILPAFPTFHHYYHHFTTNAGSSCIKWGHRHLILRLPLGNCKSYLHFRYTTALAVSSSKNTLIIQESTFRQYFVKIYILVYRTRRKCRSSFRPVSFMMFRSGGLYWISPKPLVQSIGVFATKVYNFYVLGV